MGAYIDWDNDELVITAPTGPTGPTEGYLRIDPRMVQANWKLIINPDKIAMGRQMKKFSVLAGLVETKVPRFCAACGGRITNPQVLVFCSSIFDEKNKKAICDTIIGDVVANKIPVHTIGLCEACRPTYTFTCTCCGVLYVKSGPKDAQCICKSCREDIKGNACGVCGKEKGTDCVTVYSRHGVPIVYCKDCFDKYLEAGKIVKCPLCEGYYSVPYPVRQIIFTPKKKKAYTKTIECCGNCKNACIDCFICGRSFEKKDTVDGICLACSKNSNKICIVCGEKFVGLRQQCGNCVNEKGFVNKYNYRTKAIGVGLKPWFGLEIETTGFGSNKNKVEVSRVVQLGIGKKGKKIYQKHDGSIGEFGIEFCFHPRSLNDWFSDSGVELLTEFKNVITRYGGHSYKTGLCGIHVHRSHDDLTLNSKGDFTYKGRINLLVSALSIEPYLEILSQRTGINSVIDGGRMDLREHGSFRNIKYLLGEHEVLEIPLVDWYKRIRKGIDQIDRHTAVNVNTGLPTIEFRLFRGTTNVDTILSYIAITHFVTEWSKSVNIFTIRKSNPATCWEMFMKFVKADKSAVANHFLAYSKSKGLI